MFFLGCLSRGVQGAAKLVENGVEEALSYCSSNILVEDTSVLGLAVLSLAISHNREVKFGACFFCFGELNGTCGHRHMFMLVFSVHTQMQTPPV